MKSPESISPAHAGWFLFPFIPIAAAIPMIVQGKYIAAILILTTYITIDTLFAAIKAKREQQGFSPRVIQKCATTLIMLSFTASLLALKYLSDSLPETLALYPTIAGSGAALLIFIFTSLNTQTVNGKCEWKYSWTEIQDRIRNCPTDR